MIRAKYWVPLLLSAVLLPCAAQTQRRRLPPKITKVTVIDPNGAHITQLEVELQKAPDSMEPVAEPRQIRIDDRDNVRFLLTNLSPLDVCARYVSAPTPTAETPVGESIATTVAGLGGLAVGSTTSTLTKAATMSKGIAAVNSLTIPAAPTRAARTAKEDPEYRNLIISAKKFFCQAQALVGVGDAEYPAQCDPREAGRTQLSLAKGIDDGGRTLAGYAATDFRGTQERLFSIEFDQDLNPPGPNPALDSVRKAYLTPLPSIDAAGRLQATVDEIGTWGTDLHKKYDYKAPTGDGGGASAEPLRIQVVRGALLVAPTTLSFSPGTLTQIVEITSGGQASTFTATPSSSSGWLKLSKAGTVPSNGTLVDTAPTRGTFQLIVTADDGLTGTQYGAIVITGTGAATGTTNVNVKFAPSSQPSEVDLKTLAEVDQLVDRAKAAMSLISDNNKTLEAAQGTLKTAYMALVRVEDDFNRRKGQKTIQEVLVKLPDDREGHKIVQAFNLGTDRKDTATGYFACVSDIDGKTATTSNIYYTLLYQDVPHWSASAGFLTSFLGKRIIGIADQNLPPSSPPVDNPVFAVTDHAQVQLVPMAFVNYRIFPYASSQYGKGKESELVWTTHLSAGVGVNPNTGTNQPEFFFGLSIGLNRFMLHPGIHVGRTENLGGGYLLGTPVPMTLTAAPISWSYHMAFSLGFSVRVAPY